MANEKITWSDIQEGHQDDIKRAYKMDDRRLEQALRKQLYGANMQERRQVYETLYGKRKK